MSEHELQNAMTIRASTPDDEIIRWMEASFVLLERIAGPQAKNIRRQRERRDLDGPMKDMAWVAARIRFESDVLTVDAGRLKHEGELLDAHLRTPVIDPKKMGRT